MRVALVSAPYDTAAFRVGENLGIKYLAAVLHGAGVAVDVFEPALIGLDNREVAARLLSAPYDLIGFSVMFDSALPNTLEIVRHLRDSGCQAHITAGGHVPTFNHVEILAHEPGLDSIVRFEGEETLVELVGMLDHPRRWPAIRGLSYRETDEIVTNPPRALIANLDGLPFPTRDPTSRHLGDPHFFVVTTRGCPFVCTFCSIPAFYKTPPGTAWRARSIENVVSELEYLASEWGATTVSFLDDEFLVGRNGKRRAIRLAEELQRRHLNLTWSFECRADDVDEDLFASLKAGGLRHVFVGIESGVQRVLDTFDKRTTVDQNRRAIETIRKLDLSLATGFIMFDPYTTTDELRENVRFLRDMLIGSYKAVANRVLVYRGTRLERDLARQGRLLRDGLVRGFDFQDAGVELAYQLVTKCLEPNHMMDVERRRVEFRLDNAPIDSPVVEEVRARLSCIEHEVNAALAQTMNEIISFAEEDSGADPRTLTQFEREMRDRVTCDVSRRLDDLDRLRQDLEAIP